jgi:hypothetical protein
VCALLGNSLVVGRTDAFLLGASATALENTDARTCEFDRESTDQARSFRRRGLRPLAPSLARDGESRFGRLLRAVHRMGGKSPDLACNEL